jgi:hypothetical protein
MMFELFTMAQRVVLMTVSGHHGSVCPPLNNI